ncbi:P-loop NTPase family protein [Neokomagataea thailandica]|uniref:CobQ/CobB/MinD/ParA nucleotide binding domain-containing protein n=1 Tax=Neokomagataea tanensis NBRC 106556 TaxID=1223519 RepID=A0ABQ0QL43_9PROT|nr:MULTISPECIES: hypothetical protein [Neokomagataea]GBR48693.1 hypothetical protein AA106556_1862 [Neokomagataea tanensis NBRC 106556]
MQKDTTSKQPPRVKVVFKAGRGNLGGTTTLALLAERALNAGRPVLMADADVRNQGISQFKPLYDQCGIGLPASDSQHDVQNYLSKSFARALTEKKSVFIDVGGGDRTLEEWTKRTQIEQITTSMGIEVIAVFMCGIDSGDIDYIVNLWNNGGFRPQKSLIVFNQNAVPMGQDASKFIKAISVDARFDKMRKETDLEFVSLQANPFMNEVKASGLTFHEAARRVGHSKPSTLDPLSEAVTGLWIDNFEKNLVEQDVVSWLP